VAVCAPGDGAALEGDDETVAGASSWVSRLSIVRPLVVRARLIARLLRDASVPRYVKALAVVPVLYVISPLDVLPDFLPVLGQLDDLGVVLMAMEGLIALCPREVVEHHRSAILQGQRWSPAGSEGQVIDAEWRRVE
jgi:uncharacterized membrane protein YkvA (DUF1232 family)